MVDFLRAQVYQTIFDENCPFFEHQETIQHLPRANKKAPVKPKIEIVQNPFTVFVKTLTGKTVEVEVGPENTIDELRTIDRGRTGVPEDVQRLIFGGHQLGDGRTISDYRVTNESTLHLIQRLAGC